MKPKYEPIAVSGIELRREGDYAVVLVEVNGEYHEVIREHCDANFDHHITCNGIRATVYGDRSQDQAPASAGPMILTHLDAEQIAQAILPDIVRNIRESTRLKRAPQDF